MKIFNLKQINILPYCLYFLAILLLVSCNTSKVIYLIPDGYYLDPQNNESQYKLSLQPFEEGFAEDGIIGEINYLGNKTHFKMQPDTIAMALEKFIRKHSSSYALNTSPYSGWDLTAASLATEKIEIDGIIGGRINSLSIKADRAVTGSPTFYEIEMNLEFMVGDGGRRNVRTGKVSLTTKDIKSSAGKPVLVNLLDNMLEDAAEQILTSARKFVVD